MTTIDFTFCSNEQILLGARFSRGYSFDEDGNPGPNLFTVSLGFFFFTVSVQYIKLT